VLDLIVDLNRQEQRTIVMVLHDLNHACRYADHLVAMRSGRVIAEGHPTDIITAELVENLLALRCQIITDPVSGTPLVLPYGRHHAPVPVNRL
jgi:iron complex transport system ATP-binding protein